jgi:hypothetical protein
VAERRGMSVARFAAFCHEAALGGADRAWLDPALAATPALSRILVQTPAGTHDPHLDNGRPRARVLQLYSEEAAGRNAPPRHRQIGATPDAQPSLSGAATTQQPMRVRAFSVPEPRHSPVICSYLVAHEGEANDLDARVADYTTHHTAIMARFPGIRDNEVDMRIDWCDALPWPQVKHMLVNKVVFDDPPGLTAVLNSPARDDVRAVAATLRQSTDPVMHFPVHTAAIDLSRCAGAVAARERGG